MSQRTEATKSRFSFPSGVCTGVWVTAFVAAGAMAYAACSGSDQPDVEEPGKPTIEMAIPDDDDGPEPVEVSADKIDEIQRYFERKNRFLNTCFTNAITAGEISKRGSARIAVTVVITTAGKVRSPKVTKMEPESDTLSSCIFEKMTRWKLPTLVKDFPYSHTFGFTTL